MRKINKDILQKRLDKIEKELDIVRTSTLQDGWQTSKYARKARKWDVLAQEKMKLKEQIEYCNDENADIYCSGCNCWKSVRAYCS